MEDPIEDGSPMTGEKPTSWADLQFDAEEPEDDRGAQSIEPFSDFTAKSHFADVTRQASVGEDDPKLQQRLLLIVKIVNKMDTFKGDQQHTKLQEYARIIISSAPQSEAPYSEIGLAIGILYYMSLKNKQMKEIVNKKQSSKTVDPALLKSIISKLPDETPKPNYIDMVRYARLALARIPA